MHTRTHLKNSEYATVITQSNPCPALKASHKVGPKSQIAHIVMKKRVLFFLLLLTECNRTDYSNTMLSLQQKPDSAISITHLNIKTQLLVKLAKAMRRSECPSIVFSVNSIAHVLHCSFKCIYLNRGLPLKHQQDGPPLTCCLAQHPQLHLRWALSIDAVAYPGLAPSQIPHL